LEGEGKGRGREGKRIGKRKEGMGRENGGREGKGREGKGKEDLHPTQFFGPDYSGYPAMAALYNL